MGGGQGQGLPMCSACKERRERFVRGTFTSEYNRIYCPRDYPSVLGESTALIKAERCGLTGLQGTYSGSRRRYDLPLSHHVRTGAAATVFFVRSPSLKLVSHVSCGGFTRQTT